MSDFSGLQVEWDELLSRSPSATIFDTFEWQFTWWSRIGRKAPGAQLRIVLLRDDAKTLVGIFPFYVRLWLCWPLRRLLFIGAGTSDYHDVIATAGMEELVVRELGLSLIELIDWSVADLRQLREDGLIRRHLQLSSLNNIEYLDMRQEECPYLDFQIAEEPSQRWELLLAGYSKKMRGNVRYYDRALDRVYTVERNVAEAQDEVSEALSALFVLHQRRWNQRWLPGVFYSKAVRGFHRQVACQLLEKGRLRLHYLKLDGFIEAVLYCFSFNGVTSYYQGGYEPSLSRLSLGSVVTGLAIQSAANEGNSKFDFLRGDEPYKRRWTLGKSAWNHRWFIARRSFKFFSVSCMVVRLEERVEQRFKEWMHHQGSQRNVDQAEKDGR